MAKKQGPTEQEIAEAAYHRYLKRGGHGGSEFDDWIEAERELAARTIEEAAPAKAQGARPRAQAAPKMPPVPKAPAKPRAPRKAKS